MGVAETTASKGSSRPGRLGAAPVGVGASGVDTAFLPPLPALCAPRTRWGGCVSDASTRRTRRKPRPARMSQAGAPHVPRRPRHRRDFPQFRCEVRTRTRARSPVAPGREQPVAPAWRRVRWHVGRRIAAWLCVKRRFHGGPGLRRGAVTKPGGVTRGERVRQRVPGRTRRTSERKTLSTRHSRSVREGRVGTGHAGLRRCARCSPSAPPQAEDASLSVGVWLFGHPVFLSENIRYSGRSRPEGDFPAGSWNRRESVKTRPCDLVSGKGELPLAGSPPGRRAPGRGPAVRACLTSRRRSGGRSPQEAPEREVLVAGRPRAVTVRAEPAPPRVRRPQRRSGGRRSGPEPDASSRPRRRGGGGEGRTELAGRHSWPDPVSESPGGVSARPLPPASCPALHSGRRDAALEPPSPHPAAQSVLETLQFGGPACPTAGSRGSRPQTLPRGG